jgi:peptide deformylase
LNFGFLLRQETRLLIFQRGKIMGMKLKICQAGEPVLRQQARPLSTEEIKSASIQQLIELMRETMRDISGVGLAAPQIGLPIQLAVIEDREEYQKHVPPVVLAERERSPVPFHVIINPLLTVTDNTKVEFFEWCLSIGETGCALVPRATVVRVECLDHLAEPVIIEARGWYARILQHEIDHLQGTLFIDRMESRSFTTKQNLDRYWNNQPIEQVRVALNLPLPDR